MRYAHTHTCTQQEPDPHPPTHLHTHTFIHARTVVIILGLVWVAGVAFMRLFEPNTLTWVGIGMAVASILSILATYCVLRYTRRGSRGQSVRV